AVAASQAIRESRIDIVLAVGLGGLVTASIMITGAAASSQNEFALDQLPVQLGHLLSPDVARLILGLGLVGAGLSSAITAPLAACYAAAGIFDWPTELKARQNRWVFGTVLIAGWAVGAIGILWQVRPEWAIIIAQAANGMILPVLALLLWSVASKRSILGDFVTGRFANIASFLVVATLSVIWLINLVGKLWSRFGGG
ncbi:MAG: divalent metal cation transporter, partial [Planctomycetota bacterium]|nr:divalent metal cation transporter [Planctomycetota bacterium]